METLGSASVIASDKTGTLTRNEMTIGLIMGIATLLTIDIFLPGGLFHGSDSLDVARTAGFTTLVFAQLFNAFNSRSDTTSAFHRLFVNKWLGAPFCSRPHFSSQWWKARSCSRPSGPRPWTRPTGRSASAWHPPCCGSTNSANCSTGQPGGTEPRHDGDDTGPFAENLHRRPHCPGSGGLQQ